MSATDVTLRPGRAAEASVLSDLALCSKGHWGHDAAFLEACCAELTLTTDQALDTVVAEVSGMTAGFHLLADDPSLPVHSGELAMLFVDPAYIGSGVGTRLLAGARAQAASRGWTTLRIEADPDAEPFYLAKGARRIGEVASGSVAGRTLPLLEIRCP